MTHPRRLLSFVARVAPPRSIDVLFGGIATALGLVSLAYPFGRDQSLFYYAAREWLERGQVLYRDVWDQKPPVIYFIHMLVIAGLGEHSWGIRLVELLVAVPLTGWVCARLAVPRGQSMPPGTVGAAWLGAAVVQYGYLTYWDSAQCEIWYALFAVAGTTVVLRGTRHRYVIGGALAALSLLTKPPAMPFVAICVGAIVVRVRSDGGKLRAGLRAARAFAAGGLAIGATMAVALGALHALGPMLDIVVGANGVYVRNETGIRDGWEIFPRTVQAFSMFRPFSTALVVVAAIAAFLGYARRDVRLARRYGLPLLLALASSASVVMQLKFYFYHWGPLISVASVFFALLWVDCSSVAQARPAWVAPAAFLAFAGGLYAFSGENAERWVDIVHDTLRYERGAIDRDTYASRYDIPNFYSEGDSEKVARWLDEHSIPADTVVVRGFEPQIYALSNRHFTGRFFWTTFLTESHRVYRRDELLAEDRAEIVRRPPRFAVALRAAPTGVDSAAWFEELGYEQRADIGGFTVLERAALRANDGTPR